MVTQTLCINFSFLSFGFQELKGLRSQLHQAADYCETTFLKTKEKNEWVLYYFLFCMEANLPWWNFSLKMFIEL